MWVVVGKWKNYEFSNTVITKSGSVLEKLDFHLLGINAKQTFAIEMDLNC